jgi:uncharacterized repeat protein (TIGR01451 family)
MGRCAGLVVAGAMWMLAFTSVAGANTFYVNSNVDTTDSPNECANVQSTDYTPSGPSDTCTLRDAIEAVTSLDQASPGPNTIAFITCGAFIVGRVPLPDIPGDTTLDGTQAVNASCADKGANNPFRIENYGYANLEGKGSGPGGAAGFPGLVVDGSGSTIIGMVIGGFTDGMVLKGGGDDQIYMDGLGSSPFELGGLVPENSANGIEVNAGSADDVIGYMPPYGDHYHQNDIYGNGGWGVMLDSGSGPTAVGHDFIGTDTTGHEYGPGTEGYIGPAPDYDPLPGNGPSDGNGAGGVYVGDSSGDVIGGEVQCMNVGDTCTSNVISNNGGPGVEIAHGASGATVAGNYIGESLDFYVTPLPDGGPLPNDGPGVLDGGTDDTTGGSDAGASNMISGNSGPGVELEGSGANVDGNQIGLDLAGTGASPNQQAGILATDAGGVSTGNNRVTGNTIGGNDGPGIQLDQAHNTIISNFIGTAGDHVSPLANAIGILARTGPEQIGGIDSGPNTIAYNDGAGVAVVDPPDSSLYTSGVEVVDNSIFANTGLGIDLGDDGVTQNHTLESTPGPNGWQNFPVLTSATDANGQFVWHGSLDAAPNSYYTVLVFGNNACDPSGYGQGQTLISSGAVTTDSSGQANFVLSGAGDFSGMALSATALGVNNSSSEFGPCITVGSGVDLAVSQSVSGGAKVIAGEPVDIDIHVTNKGPTEATNIVLTDTVPQDAELVSQPAGCPAPIGGKLSCLIGSLASGASEDVHVLLEPDDDAQTLTNSVTVTADQIQSVPGDNTSNFATAVTPNPNAPGVPKPSNEPAPIFGHYVLLSRESGRVTATLPNGQVIELRDFALVPVGTVVQASAGVVRVTDELPGRAARTTYANFKYGRFKIAQARTKGGLLNAVMNGSLAGCSSEQLSTSASRRRSRGEGPVATAARRRPRFRRLWGNDANNGNFTITGNRGAATVRGTIWEVEDTCTTTKVIVYQGVVDVTGFGKTEPRHATVRAGHRVVLRAG